MLVDERPLRAALYHTLAGLAPRIPDNDGGESETSYANLRWMVQTCLDDINLMPTDKISRWIGFVQGVLASKGLLSVAEERDRTRPFFHDAYAQMGLERPPSRDRSRLAAPRYEMPPDYTKPFGADDFD